ncbi:hypothetical protein [Niabella hibiscisoli]|uniref:hypothetical protein n=1 Tax=Niabella hibiscisoli TaxID=1825928 RepID=UPI001F0F6E2B|nr:hypothetical protein [Niabella hibiscisoli]MCH5715339.1 hypothetical protein [Niabella hibiscisoli]
MTLLLTSCVEKEKAAPSIAKTLVIQPFSGISQNQVDNVSKQLRKHFRTVKISKEIDLPQSAFYPPRQRYRADSLLSFLLTNEPDQKVTVLGVTDKDISVGKNDIIDWGVMGLSYRPGRSSVVSTFRLSKTQVQEQLYKVAVHELGHASGLPHCQLKTCYMRNADGGNPLNEETGFCEKCKSYLVERNWIL